MLSSTADAKLSMAVGLCLLSFRKLDIRCTSHVNDRSVPCTFLVNLGPWTKSMMGFQNHYHFTIAPPQFVQDTQTVVFTLLRYLQEPLVPLQPAAQAPDMAAGSGTRSPLLFSPPLGGKAVGSQGTFQLECQDICLVAYRLKLPLAGANYADKAIDK